MAKPSKPGKPNSSIITSLDEFKRSFNRKGSEFRSRNSLAGSVEKDYVSDNKSKFLNALKKRSHKIDTVV